MEKIRYVDLLFTRISKALSREELLYLEDDIEIAKGLGDIPNKQDLLILKLALQSKYSYIIFKEVLEEMEIMNGIVNPESKLASKFEKEVKTVQLRLL